MSADAPPTPAVITEDQIRDLVTEADALASARAAFSAMATEGAVQQPPPMGYALPENDVEIHVKGAALAGHSAMAVKMANGGYKNRERGLGPAGSGLVIVVDTKTGYPVAVLLENAYLTDMRTAAAGALASMLLCVDKAEAGASPTLAILGAGVQARLHARSVTSAMPGFFSSIVLWARDAAKGTAAAESLQAELGEAIAVSSASTVEQAVAGAALVVTVTPSHEALLEAEWLHPSATVVAVGSDGEGKREVGDSVLTSAVLSVVDNREQCGSLGELQYAAAEQVAAAVPLGEIVLGSHAGRPGAGIVLCDLTGCGAQDAAIGAEVWEKLQKRAAL